MNTYGKELEVDAEWCEGGDYWPSLDIDCPYCEDEYITIDGNDGVDVGHIVQCSRCKGRISILYPVDDTKAYKSGCCRTKIKVYDLRVDVFTWEDKDEKGVHPPRGLKGFSAWANRLLMEIPEEFRDRAIVDISASVFYKRGCPAVKIWYLRPYDLEENIGANAVKIPRAKKEEFEKYMMYKNKFKELDSYLRLKKKFEGKGEPR